VTLTYIFCLDLWPHVNTNYAMFPDCPLEQAMEADTGWWVWHLRWLRHRQWPWPRFHLDLWPQGEEIPHGSFHIEGAPAQWGLQHGQIWGLYRYKGKRMFLILNNFSCVDNIYILNLFRKVVWYHSTTG